MIRDDHADSGVCKHHPDLHIRNTDGNGTHICGVSGIILKRDGIRKIDALHIGFSAGCFESVLIGPDQLQFPIGIPGQTRIFLSKASVHIRDQTHVDLDSGHAEELRKGDLLGIGVHGQLLRSEVCNNLAVVEPVFHDEVREALHPCSADSVQIFPQGFVFRRNLSVLRQLMVIGVELLNKLGAVASISGFDDGEQITIKPSQRRQTIRCDEVLHRKRPS